MDRKTLKDISYNIAVKELAQPWTNLTYHGTQGPGYLRYDPSFAYSGEGSNMYGLSNYSITNPEVAGYYAKLGPDKGTVLTELLPDEKYYINPDLSFYNQSPEVQEALKKAGYEVLPEGGGTFEDFIKSKGGYTPYNHRDLMNMWNEEVDRTFYGPLPTTNVSPAGNSLSSYKDMLDWSKKAGLAGIVRYKPTVEGQEPVKVFQTTHPDNIEIRSNIEPVQRKYAKKEDVEAAQKKIMKGFQNAERYQKKLNTGTTQLQNIATKIMSHPVVKVGGKVMGGLGTLSSLAGAAEGMSGTGRGIMPTLGGLYGGPETAQLLKQGVDPRVVTQMNYESFNLNTPEDWEAYREALKKVPVNYNRWR